MRQVDYGNFVTRALLVAVIALLTLACGDQETYEPTQETREGEKKERGGIAIVTQPENGVAGQKLTASFQLIDHGGAPVSASGVTFRVFLNKNSFSQGGDETAVTTDDSGMAHLEFAIEQANEGYALLVTAIYQGQPTTSATTSYFDISAGEPFADTSWITGTNGVTNDPSGAQITIELRDSYGNPVAGIRPSFGIASVGDVGATKDENVYHACDETDAAGTSTCTMTTTRAGQKPLKIIEPVEVEGDVIEFIWDCDENGLLFGGGTGVGHNPFRICAPRHLNTLRQDNELRTQHFVVVEDIDMTTIEDFSSIGDIENPFVGHFDGNDKRISGLLIRQDDDEYVGFFGAIGSDGVVENTILDNIEVRGGAWVGGLAGMVNGTVRNTGSTGRVEGANTVGGLVGQCTSGTISASYATSRVLGEELNAGGLVGSSFGCEIRDSYATGRVEGVDYVGGLIGNNLVGQIRASYSTGRIEGADYVGGLVGSNVSGHISDAYAVGHVSGMAYVGGLVGSNSGSQGFFGAPRIETSYASGRVDGNAFAGGLVASGLGSTVASSYWDYETSVIANSQGGVGLSTTDFTDESIFTNAGWDFTDTWVMGTAPDEETRPILQWQAE